MRSGEYALRAPNRIARIGAFALFAALAGCDAPPPETYIGGVRPDSEGVLVGTNSVGDSCRQFAIPKTDGADIYCGKWTAPAGRVRAAAGQGPLAQQTAAYAATLAPRVTDCGAAQAATVPGADQAVQMSCARGRWTHVVMGIQSGGKVYMAEGMDQAVPSMQRSVGILSGKAQPLAEQEAARRSAVRRPDANDFQGLMLAGSAANRDSNFEEAANYFRQAVRLQEKAARKDDWALFSALMGLATQLSNQGKYPEADVFFQRADAPNLRFSGPLTNANYDHYRGLDQLNRGADRGNNAADLDAALGSLRRAEASYTEQLPKGEQVGTTGNLSRFSLTPIVSQLAGGYRTLTANPGAIESVLGAIETKRNQAVVLLAKGDVEGSIAQATAAEDFARAQGMTLPRVSAFFYRTSGIALLAGGQISPSVDRLNRSVSAFQSGWKGAPSIQLAQAQLNRAEALLRGGDTEATFQSCKDAAALLRNLRQGVTGELLAPCLAAYARQIENAGESQGLLSEMFDVAQLARGSATAELTQKAALRLSQNDKVAGELAARDNAGALLNDLRERRAAASGGQAADLDRQIEQAEAALRQSEVDLQQALPNYHTLVETAVPAATLFKALRPNEAVAVTSLSERDGWVFLLRDNRIRLSQIKGGNKRMGELVDAVRKTIEVEGGGLPAFDAAAARTLYAETLGGVADGLEGATELTVVPSGRLLSVPFQMLIADAATGPATADTAYLVKKFAITHVPSAANLVRLREASVKAGDPSSRRWFGFGASRPVTLAEGARLYPSDRCGESASARDITRLAALPGAAQELSTVGRLFRAGPGDEIKGAAFTRKAALARGYADYRVVHFAAHALLAKEVACQDEPAIVTTVEGNDAAPQLLTATDILVGMKLNADVVVLSACNTGGASGKEGGEGLSGLARSFFFAGARSLMVTHWPVDDASSVFLVQAALNGMRTSASGAIAPALRQAQLQMLGTQGYEHPFFWAPLAVIGEGGGRAGSATVAFSTAEAAR